MEEENPNMESKKFYTVEELAQRYGVALSTVYRWLKEGEIKGFRAYSKASWRFTAEAIERFEGRKR